MNSSAKRFSFTWMINLFGTAVGAGVLFLPINAGQGGFYPLIIMALLVGPMTYLAHLGLARFVLSSKKAGSDVTFVAREHFGAEAGKLITLLYFFAIFPILLAYGVGITNVISSFMVNQLGMAEPSRFLLSGICVFALVGIMLLNEKLVLRITELLIYPLVAILFGLSLYLIPQWNTAMLSADLPSAGDFFKTLWITIPVLVFAFNHSPAISSSALSHAKFCENDPNATDKLMVRSLRGTAGILVGFVMFFVFSCVLTLSPEELLAAKQQNIPILSFLANKFDNPIISYFGPAVAFFAITSSFFGHYLGAREGMEGFVNQMRGTPIEPGKFRFITAALFFVTIWLVAYLNPSILGFIESLGGPVIAMILFLMPMYAIHTVPALARFKGKLSNIFVVVMGLVAISAIVINLF